MTRHRRRGVLAAVGAALTGGCVQSVLDRTDRTTQRLPDGEAPMPGGCERSRAWPSYQGDPQNTGYTSVQSGPATLGTTTTTLVSSTPVADEIAPVGTDQYTILASSGGLLAVDREAERVVWRTQFRSQPTSTPALGCRTAFVQTAQTLRALDLRDGDVLWQTSDGASISDPNVELFDETLYYSASGTVAARRATTGERLWDTRVETDTEPYLYHGLAVSDEFVIATSGADNVPGAVVAFDRADGSVAWVTDGIFASAPPSIHDRRVYVHARSGRLVALSLQDGSRKWTYGHDGSAHDAAPTVHPDMGLVYAPTGGHATIDAVEIDSGEQAWSSNVLYLALHPVLATRDRVYYGGNELYAFDAETGEELWVDTDRATIESPLALLDGSLHVNSGDGLRRWSDGAGAT